MKNIQKAAICGVLAVSFSALAFGQILFNEIKIKGTSPNVLTGVNNSGQVLVNVATQSSYQVEIWNRLSGLHNLGLANVTGGGWAINSLGDVVGAGDPNHSGIPEAFVWQPSGAQWLGSLGGGLSAASGINASGTVVGFSYTPGYLQHAFLWTQGGGMQDLTPDLTSTGGATATAINSSGEVVGYYFPNGS